jgi:hypothetical protein
MHAIRSAFCAILFLVPGACSASGGGGGLIGATGGSSGQVNFCSTDCNLCTGCFDKCMCATQGDYMACAPLCGMSSAGGSGGVGGGAAGSGAAGSGAAGGTGAVGGGGSGGGPAAYPPPPYGTSVGATVDGTLNYQGFFEGSGQQSTIQLGNYYDPDGSKGINALLITHSALWCGACQQEAAEMNGHMSGDWGQRGTKILTLLIEDSYQQPAQVQHAAQWRDMFSAQGWSVAADPQFTFANFGSNGLPLQILVDPRTMKIIDKQDGYSPYYPALETLLNQNM